MSVVALATGAPFIFPSLGPTAFLVFYTPTAPAASPRNTICGHLIGALAGWLSLAIFGLTEAPPVLTAGVEWPRVGAAALSLGATAGLMVLFRVPHPPAGATTLIISLGLMPHPWQILVLMAAVVLLTLQAFAINRLAGIAYPMWAPTTQAVSPVPPDRAGRAADGRGGPGSRDRGA
ncbi:MAG: HPP family protein [Chloroflexi bacterium]|nr:HPP family protein [Chloroflexota bacterium]